MKTLVLLLVALISYCNGWSGKRVIPTKEDDTCAVGTEISCNSVISENNTVLRYERGNVTGESSSIPSENCPWKIKVPRGTRVMIRTTCYHHFHVRNLTEYAVCYSLQYLNDKSLPITDKECGAGYVPSLLMPAKSVTLPSLTEVKFSVYYDKGHKHKLGFTMEISFIGTPLADPVTTAPTVPSTTSNALPGTRTEFPSLLLFVTSIYAFLMRL